MSLSLPKLKELRDLIAEGFPMDESKTFRAYVSPGDFTDAIAVYTGMAYSVAKEANDIYHNPKKYEKNDLLNLFDKWLNADMEFPETFNYDKALIAINIGHSVRRKSWEDTSLILLSGLHKRSRQASTKLTIICRVYNWKPNGPSHVCEWTPEKNDIDAKDWMLIDGSE